MCEEAVDNLESAARHVGFVQNVVETESWIAVYPAVYCMSSVYDVNRTWVGGGWRDSHCQGESERHGRTFNS